MRTAADATVITRVVRAFVQELIHHEGEEEVEEAPAPAFVSARWTPLGLLVAVDDGNTPVERVAAIPAVLARQLPEAGLSEAAIEAPEPTGPLGDTDLHDAARLPSAGCRGVRKRWFVQHPSDPTRSPSFPQVTWGSGHRRCCRIGRF